MQFNLLGTSKFTTSCDVVTDALAKLGLSYTTENSAQSPMARVKIGDRLITGYTAMAADAASEKTRFETELKAALKDNRYPLGAAAYEDINMPMIVLLLCVLLSFGTITFAPTTTSLLEMFPSRIRYTAMSFPYHLSAAWFGGFLPATAFAIVAATGDIYSGLYYPVCISSACMILSLLFARETRGTDISRS